MTEKCFFDRRKECLVMKKMIKLDQPSVTTQQVIRQPIPNWCPSCLLWQQLEEMKRNGKE
jgi:hypothetical protein